MIACALLAATLTGWFPLFAMGKLPSQSYNEGWNAYRQWMALRGLPIYGSTSMFWITNYPPLSFHLVALLAQAKQNLVLTGRILCYLSFLAVSLLTGLMTRQVTGSRLAALFAAAWFFGEIGGYIGEHRGIDDPDMLAAAMASFGLFAYMRRFRGWAWVPVSAAAFAAALFTKQDYIAFPVAIGLHLLAARDWRMLALFAATGLVVAAGLLGLFLHIDGKYFFAELLRPRAYTLLHWFNSFFKYLWHCAIPLGIAAIGLRHGMRERRLLVILILVSNLFAAYFCGGDGVAANIWTPALIADAVVCTAAICQMQRAQGRYFRPALLAMTLVMFVWIPSQFVEDAKAAWRMPSTVAAAQRAVALLRASQGPAICEDLLLCFEAGKPMDYDPYYVKDQILIGRLREADIAALLSAHRYGAVQLRGAIDGGFQAKMHLRFSPGVQRAILAGYHPVMIQRDYTVLLPNAASAGTLAQNQPPAFDRQKPEKPVP